MRIPNLRLPWVTFPKWLESGGWCDLLRPTTILVHWRFEYAKPQKTHPPAGQ